MATTQKKQKYEQVEVAGYVGKEPKLLESKNEKKMYISFDVAKNIDQENVKWNRIIVWEDKEGSASKLVDSIKKADYVQVKGYEKPYTYTDKKTGEIKKAIDIIATEVHNHKINPETKIKNDARDSVKGNLGGTPEIKTVKTANGEKEVAVFSLALKKANKDDKTEWVNVQVWDKNIAKSGVKDLGKNDYVELKGTFGKEYTTKSGEVKRDLIANEVNVLKKNVSQEMNLNHPIHQDKGVKVG